MQKEKRFAVNYYEYCGGREFPFYYVAIKGIDVDHYKLSTELEVHLFGLKYSADEDWHATGKEVSIPYAEFVKNFKESGTCFLY